jgi:hypothetical protein
MELQAVRRQRRENPQATCVDRVGTDNFYVEDPDGYIIGFGGAAAG